MTLTANFTYAVRCTRARQLLCDLQKRWLSQEPFSVIRMPVPTVQKLERAKVRKKKKERDMMIERSRQGDMSVPIISCKRKELNYYSGQSYGKFTEIPLASKGWKHIKAAGDYFTIHGHKANPSLTIPEEEEQDFESLGLNQDLLSEIYKLKFEKPTNIQALAIPHLLDGHNSLITAETGNGKTLAFLAPMLQQISRWKDLAGSQLPFNSPLGLIITPGRELAQQIHSVASALGENLGIQVDLLLGGQIRKKMVHAKMSQSHLLVATIGALSKLTTVGVYRTSHVRHLTLDEADTLLDDSFNEQVLRYISKIPIQGVGARDVSSDSSGDEPLQPLQPELMSGAQLTLVAATLPTSLNSILQPIVNNDSLVHLSTPHLNRFMPHVPQRFIKVNKNTKPQKLMELVKKDANMKRPVVIFSQKSKRSDWISLYLNENGVSCGNLNGAMPAALRKDQFEAFQSGRVLALSCTDLTSRGLDTVQAGHVINYDFPEFAADYIHRCGRTGRVGSVGTGLVTSLVHRASEVDAVQRIESAVRRGEPFHNVNANITRIIKYRVEREEKRAMAAM